MELSRVVSRAQIKGVTTTANDIAQANKALKVNDDGIVDIGALPIGSIHHGDLLDVGTYTHAQIDSHITDATRHRQIDDTTTATTKLWSSDKISSELADKVDSSEVGAANGIAELDSGGKVPTSQLPSSIVGAVKYLGTWDASTNTPTLAGIGTTGGYYLVSVAGNTPLGSIAEWQVGDWAIYDGTQWEKVDNTESVVSVAGRTGAVTISANDITTATTVGRSTMTTANPNAISWARVNVDNTITYLSPANTRTALGLGSIATQNSSSVAIGGGSAHFTSQDGFGLPSLSSSPVITSLLGTASANANLLQYTGRTTTTLKTLVEIAEVQTLTNKTINGSNNTLQNLFVNTGSIGTLAVGNGGTGQTTVKAAILALVSGVSTPTQGALLHHDGTDIAPLPLGTSGYVLRSSGGNVVWSAPAASAFTDTTDASNITSGAMSPSRVTGTAAILGANTFTGVQTLQHRFESTKDSAASVSAVTLSGYLFTSGGTGTTTFPHFLINPPDATTVTSWSTAGTVIGINTPSGFTGDSIAVKANGSSGYSLQVSQGNMLISGGYSGLYHYFQSGGGFYGIGNGVIRLSDSGGTTGMLQVGGTSSSSPAIKKNGATLEVRAADDSGYLPIVAGANSRIIDTLIVDKSGYTEAGGLLTATDPLNTGTRALSIVPPAAYGRIYFGSSALPIWALNFANVSGVENFPSIVTVSPYQIATYVGNVTLAAFNGGVVLNCGTGNAVEVRNSTNAQKLKVFNTYTSSTSWEAGVLDFQTTSNVLKLGTDKGSGGGSARDMQLIRGGTTLLTLEANTVTASVPSKLPSYTVSGLPSASTCGAGSCAFVTDATVTTAYTTVAGSGSNKVLVVSDGTNWIIH